MDLATQSLCLIFWLYVLTLTSCTILKGSDLVYKPRSPKAPRALLVNSENEPIQTVATNAFTICLVAKIDDFNGLNVVDLFSFSSRTARQTSEILLEIDYEGLRSDLYIHGTRASFGAVPPIGKWTNICSSWESKTGNANLYINGQQNGSAAKLQQGYELGDEGFFVLGQGQDDYNSEFDSRSGVRGKLTHFNLWNRVLTPNEVQQLQSCKLEGNVASWSDSNWSLYDGIQREEAEDVCGMVVAPIQMNWDEILQEIKKNLYNSTQDLQTQIIELQQRMDSLKNVGKNGSGSVSLNNNCENYENEINTLQQRNNINEYDLANLKPKISEHDKDICDLKIKLAVQTQEITDLKPKMEECCNKLGRLEENISLPSQAVSTLQQQCNKSEIHNVLQLMNTLTSSQEALNRQLNGFKICPNQFTNVYGRCYYFSRFKTQLWKEATGTCYNLDPRATLLTLETEEEWNIIRDYISDRNSMADKLWWIGASDNAHEGKFTWMKNDTTLTFSAWCPNQPDNAGNNENCVHISPKSWSRNGSLCLNDLKCNGNGFNMNPNFICEIQD